MRKEEFLTKYGILIKGAFVESFGLEGQFPILELINESQNLRILFHIDCKITTNNTKINEAVELLKSINKDVYQIAYFFAINLKTVEDVIFEKDSSLILVFENKVQLIFTIIGEWSEPLNISFINESQQIYGTRFWGDGTIEK